MHLFFSCRLLRRGQCILSLLSDYFDLSDEGRRSHRPVPVRIAVRRDLSSVPVRVCEAAITQPSWRRWHGGNCLHPNVVWGKEVPAESSKLKPTLKGEIFFVITEWIGSVWLTATRRSRAVAEAVDVRKWASVAKSKECRRDFSAWRNVGDEYFMRKQKRFYYYKKVQVRQINSQIKWRKERAHKKEAQLALLQHTACSLLEAPFNCRDHPDTTIVVNEMDSTVASVKVEFTLKTIPKESTKSDLFSICAPRQDLLKAWQHRGK